MAVTSTVGAQSAKQEPAVPLRVRAATRSCVGAEEFFDRIRERTALVRAANASEAAVEIVVLVTTEVTASGELKMVGLDGAVTTRHVVGDCCNEVADALALVSSLTFDPMALSNDGHVDRKAAPSPTDEATKGIPKQPAGNPPARADKLPEQAPTDQSATDDPPPLGGDGFERDVASNDTDTSDPDSISTPRVSAWHHGGSADVWARFDARSPWFGYAAQYWLEPGGLGFGSTPWRLTARISRTLRSRERVQGGDQSLSLDYQLTAADIGICPAGGYIMGSLRVLGCAAGSLGWLSVREDVASPSKADAGVFVALELGARLELRIYRGLGLHAYTALSAPITRYRTYVDSLAGSPSTRLSQLAVLSAVGVDLSDW